MAHSTIFLLHAAPPTPSDGHLTKLISQISGSGVLDLAHFCFVRPTVHFYFKFLLFLITANSLIGPITTISSAHRGSQQGELVSHLSSSHLFISLYLPACLFLFLPAWLIGSTPRVAKCQGYDGCIRLKIFVGLKKVHEDRH